MKKILGLAASVLAVAATLSMASPASAHTVELAVFLPCVDQPAGARALVKVSNDRTNLPMSFTATPEIATIVQPIPAHTAKLGSVPFTGDSVTVTLKASWPDGYKETRTVTAHRPQNCAPATTTTTEAPTTTTTEAPTTTTTEAPTTTTTVEEPTTTTTVRGGGGGPDVPPEVTVPTVPPTTVPDTTTTVPDTTTTVPESTTTVPETTTSTTVAVPADEVQTFLEWHHSLTPEQQQAFADWLAGQQPFHETVDTATASGDLAYTGSNRSTLMVIGFIGVVLALCGWSLTRRSNY